jgi:hypothetical protein
MTRKKNAFFWDLRMIIDGTSIKNQIHIETLSFSAVFQNICFTRLRLSDFSSNNYKMLENMTCILSVISNSIIPITNN